MPDPKAPDDNPMAQDINNVSSAGRGLLSNSAPNQVAKFANNVGNDVKSGAKNLRNLAKKKLGF